jgi:hypothetical protein
MENNGDAETSQSELAVLTQILEALKGFSDEVRERILRTVATFFKLSVEATSRANEHSMPERSSFSEDRSVSPKEFLLDKSPRTDVEKVACLAFYLDHYRDTPHFKTLDISKLNTEAAQVKFANAAAAVNNATKLGYLAPATKGNKQLSASGERFVQALPDREQAKAAMAQTRPRRRARKTKSDLPGLDDPRP